MNLKVTTIKMRFILRNESGIIVPTDSSDNIKTFSYKVETTFLEEIKKHDDTFSSEYLFDEIMNSFYFNEFVIQLFYEHYEVLLTSIKFELHGQEYSISDTWEEYAGWLGKNAPRTTIEIDFGWIERDMYKFDNYVHEYGMDPENLNFKILGKENS